MKKQLLAISNAFIIVGSLVTSLFISHSAVAQSEITLPFMQNIAQGTGIFPTNTPNYDVMVSFSGYAGLSNSQFSYKDLLSDKKIYLDRLPSLVSKDNIFASTVDVDLFNLRIRTRKLFWSLSVSESNSLRMNLPKDLFALAIGGNASFVSSSTKADFSSMRADLTSYASVNLGLTAPIGNKWTVGGRLRLLSGLANANLSKADVSITTTDPANYSQAVGTDYLVNLSSPIIPVDSVGKKGYKVQPKYFTSLGGGMDLGATYKLNNSLKFTGSIYNLGYIKWSTNVVNYAGKLNTVNFNGIKIKELKDSAGNIISDALGDTLGKRFKTVKTNNAYTTYLSPELFLAATYTLSSKTAISLGIHGVFYNGIQPSATVNVYQPIGRIFDITAGYTITQNTYNNLSAGVMFKPGPLQIYAVTDNVLGLVEPTNTRLLNLRVGLGLVFGRGKQRDRDKDGVPDRLDDCPDDPGLPQFKGCPDTDGDGIPNKLDECPTEFGLTANQGCPDRDNDGIRDLDDRCPDNAGEKRNQGCPDRDSDGIIDLEDQCPDSAGVEYLQGCPDNDKDTVANSLDKCPNVFGSKAHNGCPDTDKDGIYDDSDKCPTVAGPVENNGCPYGDSDDDKVLDKDDACPDVKGPVDNKGCPYADKDGDKVLDKDDTCPDVAGLEVNKGCPDVDTDNDGVVDRLDDCPKTVGTIANNGCPELKAEEQKVLKTAFDALEFATGKDIILGTSFPGLLELAKLLVENPEYKLRISGHTDNKGTPAANLLLSKKRALAVKKFLQLKGSVMGDNLIVEFFGQTKPIASNATKAGQAKNRRVEMKVIFE